MINVKGEVKAPKKRDKKVLALDLIEFLSVLKKREAITKKDIQDIMLSAEEQTKRGESKQEGELSYIYMYGRYHNGDLDTRLGIWDVIGKAIHLGILDEKKLKKVNEVYSELRERENSDRGVNKRIPEEGRVFYEPSEVIQKFDLIAKREAELATKNNPQSNPARDGDTIIIDKKDLKEIELQSRKVMNASISLEAERMANMFAVKITEQLKVLTGIILSRKEQTKEGQVDLIRQRVDGLFSLAGREADMEDYKKLNDNNSNFNRFVEKEISNGIAPIMQRILDEEKIGVAVQRSNGNIDKVGSGWYINKEETQMNSRSGYVMLDNEDIHIPFKQMGIGDFLLLQIKENNKKLIG